MSALSEILEARSIPEPNSGCLLWTAGVNHKGYAAVFWKGKMHKAHRLAWSERHGVIPVGIQICHKCDVRSCINADHLFPGTNRDNAMDMVIKGRNRTVITKATAMAVFTAQGTHEQVAQRFGISGTTAWKIRTKKAWSHIHAMPPSLPLSSDPQSTRAFEECAKIADAVQDRAYADNVRNP